MINKSVPFSKKLLAWYDPKARILPWKSIKDPYKIWISEIILQQTRAEQAVPYYKNFLEKFPNVDTLANAHLDEVLKAWEGLGYYSRARNLHHAAKFVQENYDSKIPSSYVELLKLKGIGPYTASAISSFAFGEAQAVLDGNVYRVLARVFGLDNPINVSASKKIFQQKLNQVFNKNKPALFNQSIMDFGATCCKPKDPSCSSCPMAEFCFAFNNDVINDLPKKIKPAKKKIRHFNFLLLKKGEEILIEQRLTKDIWRNLYQLPLFETKEIVHEDFISDNFRSKFLLRKSKKFDLVFSTTRILTHQKIFVKIWATSIKKAKFDGKVNATWVNKNEMHTLAFPKLFDVFFKQYY